MDRWQMEEWANDGIHWQQVLRNGLTMEEWRNGGMANIFVAHDGGAIFSFVVECIG